MSAITYHKHHIVPKHDGGIYHPAGSNDPSNLTLLTQPEHTEAHRLLKEKTGCLRCLRAWLMMSGKKAEGEAARIAICRSPEFKAKMSISMVEYYRSPETRSTRSKTMTGRKRSPQHSANLATALTGNTNALGCKRSPETKAKISVGRKRYFAALRAD